jgi:transposase
VFPHLAGLPVERVFAAGKSVRIRARTAGVAAACPACGVASRRVHSRYERRLADTAVGGQETLIHLRVRRFFCQNMACAKKTFAEQVPGLTTRYGRRSSGLTAVLRAVALALGGRAGARLAGRLAAAVSRMTLIRLIRALPEPAVIRAPAVLGVDDFALRRGHRYGTILVDVQSHRPVDVLPDRSADSLAAWLAARPGAQFICRDRAGCYSEGAARGAPLAIQIADRWHLWHNLGEAAERAVARHHRCLPAAVIAMPGRQPDGQAGDVPARAPAPRARTGRIAERTRQRHAAIHQLLAEGSSVRAIAAELGLARNTVRRFARASDPGQLLVHDGTGHRPSILDEHAPYLHQRWNEGCTDATRLWRELRARGYPGGYSRVRDYLAAFRGTTPAPAPVPQPPKARKVTCWLMTNPCHLSTGDQAQLAAILARCPELAALREHITGFADLMTHRRGRNLDKWITAAEASGLPELRSFTTGLRRDQDAVTAGLTLPYSSGVVEGHVNRIKMLKRQMHGRASPDLLRRRILLAD